MTDARNAFDKILSHRRFDAAFLSAACLTALLYRGWDLFSRLTTNPAELQKISFDGVYYAQIARNLLAGDGPGWEAMLFPILQPLIVAGISAVTGVTDYGELGRLVNCISGAFLLIPVYFIAKELFGRNAAVFAVMLVIPYPQLVAIATSDTTECLYSLLVYSSLWAVMATMREPSHWRSAIAGAVLGLGYLARPEGLIIFIGLLPVIFITLRRLAGNRKAAVATFLVFIAFWAVALPYAIFLHKSYGRLVLSCKLPYESIKMREAVLDMPLNTSDVFGITPSGRLAWQDYGGAGIVFGYIKDDPGKFIKAYFRNLASQLPWRLEGNSSHMTGYPDVYPFYFWIPALIGLGILLFRRRDRHLVALILVPYANMFVFPVFTKGFWLYNTPYLPTMIMLAAGAVTTFENRFKPNSKAIAALAAICTVAWWTYTVDVVKFTEPSKVLQVKLKGLVSEESLEVGKTMRKSIGTDVTYMSAWSRTVFYLGGRWVEMPTGNDYALMRYAIENNVDYIVEEKKNRPPSEKLRFLGTPGLTLVYTYKSKKAPYTVAIWKITDTEFYQ